MFSVFLTTSIHFLSYAERFPKKSTKTSPPCSGPSNNPISGDLLPCFWAVPCCAACCFLGMITFEADYNNLHEPRGEQRGTATQKHFGRCGCSQRAFCRRHGRSCCMATHDARHARHAHDHPRAILGSTPPDTRTQAS